MVSPLADNEFSKQIVCDFVSQNEMVESQE